MRKIKERMKRDTSMNNTSFSLNSVCSPWLCKECGSKSIQDVSPLISNNMNTLISEILICNLKSTVLYSKYAPNNNNCLLYNGKI